MMAIEAAIVDEVIARLTVLHTARKLGFMVTRGQWADAIKGHLHQHYKVQGQKWRDSLVAIAALAMAAIEDHDQYGHLNEPR